MRAAEQMVACARDVAQRRGLTLQCETRLNQPAVWLDQEMISRLDRAVEAAGFPVHRMVSGAGHDAMVLAPKMPAAMLFLRSPGGISHHPDESVHAADVDAALRTGLRFLAELETTCIKSD
jgi:allantoate deiminase